MADLIGDAPIANGIAACFSVFPRTVEVRDMWERTMTAGVLFCGLATGGCSDQVLLEGDNLNQPSPLLSLQSVPCPENDSGAESCKVVTNRQRIVNGMLSRLSDTAPGECWSAVWQVMERGIEGTLYTTSDFLYDQAGDASIGPYDIILNERTKKPAIHNAQLPKKPSLRVVIGSPAWSGSGT